MCWPKKLKEYISVKQNKYFFVTNIAFIEYKWSNIIFRAINGYFFFFLVRLQNIWIIIKNGKFIYDDCEVTLGGSW